MKKWEYIIVVRSVDIENRLDHDQFLNRMGGEGWEHYMKESDERSRAERYYFKRAIEDSDKH